MPGAIPQGYINAAGFQGGHVRRRVDHDVDLGMGLAPQRADQPVVRLVGQSQIERGDKRAGTLDESVSLYHEDNFAAVPQLTMVWPTVDQFHPDSYALEILSEYLSEGKRAPLNEVLIDERKLTSGVSTFNYGKVLSGEFYLTTKANAGEDLDELVPAIDTAFARFEENGISQADLDRIKAGYEVQFYGQLQSVLGKAIALGVGHLLQHKHPNVLFPVRATVHRSTLLHDSAQSARARWTACPRSSPPCPRCGRTPAGCPW